MKKVNLNKVTELINNQVTNSLKEVETSKSKKQKKLKRAKKLRKKLKQNWW